MSDKYHPKKGDRVRVVVEAEVMYTSADGYFETKRMGLRVDSDEVVSIEKIRPMLPKTPGSVVRLENDTHYLLGNDHLWRGSRNLALDPVTLAAFDPEVVYDAGVK